MTSTYASHMTIFGNIFIYKVMIDYTNIFVYNKLERPFLSHDSSGSLCSTFGKNGLFIMALLYLCLSLACLYAVEAAAVRPGQACYKNPEDDKNAEEVM